VTLKIVRTDAELQTPEIDRALEKIAD